MQSIFPQIPDKIISTIKENKSIAILSHKSPDGDALSSSQALAYILRKLGKEVWILNDGPFKRKEIEPLTKDVLTTVPVSLKEKNPLAIVVDCSTPNRPGDVYKSLEATNTIVIDHHSSGEAFVPADMSYIVPYSPSTSMLIEELRVALGIDLDLELATLLLTGVMTDTGFFHFIDERQSSYTLYKASIFASTGINVYKLYDELSPKRTIEEIEAIASIIKDTKFFYSGSLAISYQPMTLDQAGLSDTIYPQLLSIDSVRVVVFLKEKEDHFEIGFRAKRGYGLDVGERAAKLGGGGHKLAAGASYTAKRDKLENIIVNLFKEIL